MNNKRPLVMSGPSGSGKSTLLNRLFKDYPGIFGFSVSHTTRSIRPNEINGTSYHFVSKETFLSLIAENKFLEHTEFAGNMYGTSLFAVDSVINEKNQICVLDIEMNGVKSIQSHIKNSATTTIQRPYFVFIRPPSLDALKQRLLARGTETTDSIAKRLAAVEAEIAFANQPEVFDFQVINDDLDTAYSRLVDWIRHQYNLS